MTAIDVSTMVQRVRYHLGDTPWETMGTASTTSDAVVVSEADEWKKGDIGEFAGGETFYVTVASGTDNDLTATRGYLGSTAVAHTTSERIFKNPKYRYGEITNAISEVIESALPWPRFYYVGSKTITPDQANKDWYDLDDSNALALVRVDQLYNTNRGLQPYGERHRYQRIAFRRGLPTTLVASGSGVAFPDGFRHDTNTVYVYYARPFTDTITTATYADITIGDPIVSAIEYGAVALLQGDKELAKARHAADETDHLRGASVFQSLHKRALATAEKKLRQQWPLMRDWSK